MISEILHVFADPAHVVAELMWEGTFATVSFIIMKKWVKKHDKEHHGSKD